MKDKKQAKAALRQQGIRLPRFYKAIVWTVGLAAMALALLCAESDLLWKMQELNLFQRSGLFFRQQMVVPGGLLTWLGTYLTQYFYHPWAGVLVLCGCWLLLMWLTSRAFRLPQQWALLTLVPVALLLLTIVDMGYWVYILKLRGHAFVGTLGVIFAAAMLWAFRCLPARLHLRAMLMVLTTAVGYPLMGIYALGTTLLMGLFIWRLESKPRAAAYTLLAVLTVVAVPLLCYRYVYYEINLANVYWAELPLYFIQEDYHLYYLPYYLLALFYVVMVVSYREERGKEKEERDKNAVANSSLFILHSSLTLVALVAGTYFGWCKDENFHRELKMQHLVERLDWEGIVAEAAKQKDEPTRSIVMMRNLALGRLGRQGSEMYSYKNGSKKAGAPFMFRLMQTIGPMILYQYGMANYCTRYSSEMGVEYGWRAEHLKNLARCALLNHEWPVAHKYIDLLKQTTFHKGWAEEMEALIGRPDKIAQNAEMAPITHMMHYDDRLYSDNGFVEQCIMGHLAAMREVSDPYFQEQALLAAMWAMNGEVFGYHFGRYLKLHRGQQLPIHYQEAAYLFGVLSKHPDIDRFPVTQMVKDSYVRFDQAAAQCAGMSLDEARAALEPMFGNTYFYQYFLMNNLPEY